MMGASSHEEAVAEHRDYREKDTDEPVLMCTRPPHLLEDYETATGDSELWEELQDLELKEDPAELGGMVRQVKHELLGMKDMPVSVSSFRQAMDTARDLSMPVRKINPRLFPPGKTPGHPDSPLRSLTSCGSPLYGSKPEEDEELSVKTVFGRLMERLARIERRLDKWNTEHSRRLEQVIHCRPLVFRAGSSSSSDYKRHYRGLGSCFKDEHREMNGYHKDPLDGHHAHNDTFESASKDEPQPEREESPLQEEDNVNDCQVKDWVTTTGSPWTTSGPLNGAAKAHEKGAVAAQVAEAVQAARTTLRESASETKQRGSAGCETIAEKAPKEEEEEEDTKIPSKSCLAPIVYHPVFDYFFASIIVLNSLFIGVQTHYRIVNIADKSEPGIFEICEKVFAGLFFIELALRIVVLKCDFFSRKHLMWNVFDLTLVGMSGVEMILPIFADTDDPSGGAGSIGKVIRMFRMVRIIRIMRVLRFLAELRVMVTLIIHSVRSLFWLLVLLLLILYVFSIFFTQGVTDYLLHITPDAHTKMVLLKHYGGLGDSAVTLFMSITGGISWVEVVDPLWETGWAFVALFLVYVFFCVFSVLNIVTGVFVDGAIQRSAQERDLRLEKEKEQKKIYRAMCTDLLQEIDTEGTGFISRAQLEQAFKSDVVKYSFSVLDIDIADSNYLYDMLDLDGSGLVDMEEFVQGCLRLKGNAKSLDIHTLIHEVKQLMRKVDSVMGLSAEDLAAAVG